MRQLLRALVALPHQIVAVIRGSGVGRALIGLAMALVANVAALVPVFSLA